MKRILGDIQDSTLPNFVAECDAGNWMNKIRGVSAPTKSKKWWGLQTMFSWLKAA